MKRISFIFFTALASLIVLLFFEFFSFNDHSLHLVICDVGQGDAIFMRTASGSDILIDGGPDKSVLSCLASNMPLWDRDIEAIILTHPHADHLTGLISILDNYEVKEFYTEKVGNDTDIYKLLEAKLAEKKVSAKYLHVGDRIYDKNGTSLTTLWPSLETIEKSDHNASNLDVNGLSVVEKLRYGQFSALLTGDAGVAVEDRIAPEAQRTTVLKVPHHGSRTGMSDYFLSLIKPDLAVISVGTNNRYGHPSSVSLTMLKNHGIRSLRTDQNGENKHRSWRLK